MCTLIDVETKQPVNQFVFAKTGVYAIETTIIGEGMKDTVVSLDICSKGTVAALENVPLMRGDRVYRACSYIYVAEANTMASEPFHLTGLKLKTSVRSFYVVIRYQDE